MKLIATNKIPPLDRETRKFYKNEFKNDSGLILLPKKNLTDRELNTYFSIANEYDITIVGTIQKNNLQNEDGVPVIIYKHSVEQLMRPHEPFKKSFKDKLNSENDAYEPLIKIGVNGIKVNQKNICDILLMPSKKEISSEWFERDVNSILKNLNDDSRIVYSPLKSGELANKSLSSGIYDIQFSQLGDVKGDFVVYDFKK